MIEIAHHKRDTMEAATGKEITIHHRYFFRRFTQENYSRMWNPRHSKLIAVRHCERTYADGTDPIIHPEEILDAFDDLSMLLLGIGDTDFWRSGSNHPLFVAVHTYRQALDTLMEEEKAARRQVATLNDRYNDKYIAELKRRRIYKKVMNGAIAQATTEAIKAPLLAEAARERREFFATFTRIQSEREAAQAFYEQTVGEWYWHYQDSAIRDELNRRDLVVAADNEDGWYVEIEGIELRVVHSPLSSREPFQIGL
jgi:hypothetical protein